MCKCKYVRIVSQPGKSILFCHRSYDDLVLTVILSEHLGRTTLLTLEYTVEVGHIVKPAFIAYLHDRHGAVGKQA